MGIDWQWNCARRARWFGAISCVGIALATPAYAQQVACAVPNPPNTCTLSTTSHTTQVSLVLPGAAVIGGPAANYLTTIFNGPAGPALQNTLGGLGLITAGPVVPVGREQSIEVSVSTQLTIGPGTILVGPEQNQ